MLQTYEDLNRNVSSNAISATQEDRKTRERSLHLVKNFEEKEDETRTDTDSPTIH